MRYSKNMNTTTAAKRITAVRVLAGDIIEGGAIVLRAEKVAPAEHMRQVRMQLTTDQGVQFLSCSTRVNVIGHTDAAGQVNAVDATPAPIVLAEATCCTRPGCAKSSTRVSGLCDFHDKIEARKSCAWGQEPKLSALRTA